MSSRHLTVLLFAVVTSACSGDIYLRDGVTDGDTFYLAPGALADPDPAMQSWISYSLGKSTCQLRQPSDNPARASSFECELLARRLLLETWNEESARVPDTSDAYLEALSTTMSAGYLPEYVARYFFKPGWILPGELRAREFRRWQQQYLPDHRPQTRLTGSWNYSNRVTNY